MKEWVLAKRRRVIFAGILIVAIPMLGLAAFVRVTVISALEDRVIKETNQIAASAAHRIEERLRGDIGLGRVFVTRPYLLEGLRRNNKNEMTSHLKNLVENAPFLERASIVSEKGIALAAYIEDPETIGKDFSYREWYKGVSRNWTPYVSEFFMRAARPQRYLFVIAVPMRLGSEVKGILLMQPKPDYIKDALGGIKTGEGHIYVVDRKGQLIHHPDFAIDKIIDFSNVPVVQKALKGQEGVKKMVDPVEKDLVFSAYHPVNEWGWGVVVDKPVDVVLAPVWQISLWLFTVAGLLTLAGGLAASLGADLLIARRALKEERDRLFNYSMDMLCIAGFDGYFKQLNPAFGKTLGWSNEELKAKPFLDFVHPDDRNDTIEAVKDLSGGKAVTTFENRYVCKDGSYKWISWSSFPLPKAQVIFAVARDVTESKRLEQALMERSVEMENANAELQAMNEELQVMNEELQAQQEELQTQQEELAAMNQRLDSVSRAKSDFLANMSHELRTPLNSVIGFSEILQDGLYGPLNEKQQEYIADILGSGRHLLSLINDILDLSKVESGKMDFEPAPVKLKETLETSLSLSREKALKHGIRMEIDVAPEADIEIEADERKLKQILFNLLSNAVKFTPDGGSVRVSARKVTPPFLPLDKGRLGGVNADLIEISVSDTGIGIKPGDLPRLFQEFTQLESAYTKGYEGTGLGLALTKRLVELHGGRIWAESTYGKGSRFTFVIPVRQIERKAPVPEHPAVVPCAGGKRALAIDDDPKTLRILEEALRAEGYEVSTAHDGRSGVEAAQKARPDLVILDLVMPGMSGFEVLDAFGKIDAMTGIPVVVLTNISLSQDDKRRFGGRVMSVIEKGDLSRREFIDIIRAIR